MQKELNAEEFVNLFYNLFALTHDFFHNGKNKSLSSYAELLDKARKYLKSKGFEDEDLTDEKVLYNLLSAEDLFFYDNEVDYSEDLSRITDRFAESFVKHKEVKNFIVSEEDFFGGV